MIISTISVMAIMASLVISTFALANSMIFEQSVYAIDNCDSSSNCTNTQTGIGNSQFNECSNFSTCLNSAIGDGNIQSNHCDSSPGNEFAPGCWNDANGNSNTQETNCVDAGKVNFGCINLVEGDENSQNVNCDSTGVGGCINDGSGEHNSQDINCKEMSFVSDCTNSARGDHNSQNIDCISVGDFGCSNIAFQGFNGSIPVNDNSQNIKCQSEVGCFNVALGGGNIQQIDCFNGNSLCVNDSFGDKNSQNIKCLAVDGLCTNLALSDLNNQDLVCVGSIECRNEITNPEGGDVQKSVCVNSGSCLNDGTDTTLISVKSDNCESDESTGSKTICVNNRIINRPNS